jgi:hypothetical protein
MRANTSHPTHVPLLGLEAELSISIGEYSGRRYNTGGNVGDRRSRFELGHTNEWQSNDAQRKRSNGIACVLYHMGVYMHILFLYTLVFSVR